MLYSAIHMCLSSVNNTHLLGFDRCRVFFAEVIHVTTCFWKPQPWPTSFFLNMASNFVLLHEIRGSFYGIVRLLDLDNWAGYLPFVSVRSKQYAHLSPMTSTWGGRLDGRKWSGCRFQTFLPFNFDARLLSSAIIWFTVTVHVLSVVTRGQGNCAFSLSCSQPKFVETTRASWWMPTQLFGLGTRLGPCYQKLLFELSKWRILCWQRFLTKIMS